MYCPSTQRAGRASFGHLHSTLLEGTLKVVILKYSEGCCVQSVIYWTNCLLSFQILFLFHLNKGILKQATVWGNNR